MDNSLRWRFGPTRPSWVRPIEQSHGASFNTSVEDTSSERCQKNRQQSQADLVFQVVNCLIRRVEVPEALLKWSRLAREHETNEEKISESELSEIVAKYCNLQAAIESFQTRINPVDALGQALKIESELVEWALKWKAQDNFATITVDELSTDVLNDQWHLYSNIFVATTWNTYRSIRILIHQIIVNQLAHVTESPPMKSISQDASMHEFQLHASKRIVVGLSHEICASVPFFMGRSLLEDDIDYRYQPRNASRARLIVWPLYVAGQTEFVSDIMRLYAADQLERIANGVGIRKVKAFSQVLRAKQQVSVRMWRDFGMNMDC